MDQGGKATTHWTRLPCYRLWANEVHLLLGGIASNLGNLLRRLVLLPAIQSGSLTSLSSGSRPPVLTRRLFRQIVARTGRLAWHPS